MKEPRPAIDLRGEVPTRVRGLAFAEARELASGDTLALLVAEEPSLMMHSVNLQLQGRLAWAVTALENGWRVEVRHRGAAPAQDLLELLAREHRRLDGLMGEFLRQANQRDAADLALAFSGLARLLRSHIEFENARLVPLCGVDARLTPDAPTAVMLREHDEILHQLSILEDSIAADDRDEVSAFAAILSGTLAKHEHREEDNLFPRWRARLAELAPGELAQLFALAASGAAAL